jgi:CRISPR/Cas system CMR subunit Cmr6 (Cas7 group RAMP superfamily)
MDKFVRAYLTCALWATNDASTDAGVPLDQNYTISDIASSTIKAAIRDCKKFREENATALEGYSDSQAGHDLFLTRCNHGTGYWDRDQKYTTEANEKILTDAAHAMGEVWFYVGDDGKIYST